MKCLWSAFVVSPGATGLTGGSQPVSAPRLLFHHSGFNSRFPWRYVRFWAARQTDATLMSYTGGINTTCIQSDKHRRWEQQTTSTSISSYGHWTFQMSFLRRICLRVSWRLQGDNLSTLTGCKNRNGCRMNRVKNTKIKALKWLLLENIIEKFNQLKTLQEMFVTRWE